MLSKTAVQTSIKFAWNWFPKMSWVSGTFRLPPQEGCGDLLQNFLFQGIFPVLSVHLFQIPLGPSCAIWGSSLECRNLCGTQNFPFSVNMSHLSPGSDGLGAWVVGCGFLVCIRVQVVPSEVDTPWGLCGTQAQNCLLYLWVFKASLVVLWQDARDF